MIENGRAYIERKKQNDPKRFIKTDYTTQYGEIEDVYTNSIDQSYIEIEEKYDGFALYVPTLMTA